MKHTSTLFKRTTGIAAFMAVFAMVGLTACKSGDGTCESCIDKKAAPGEYATALNTINHYIPNNEARVMTERFKANMDSIHLGDANGTTLFPVYETFNLQTIDSILCQQHTVGLRIYMAMDKDNKVHLVLVGAHEDGKDVLMKAPSRVPDNSSIEGEEISAENGQRWP